MSCRVAMLRMHRDGLIVLPPPTHAKAPVKKIEFTSATDPQDPVVCTVNKLVTFKSCGLFKKLIKSRFHSKVMLENKNQKERDRDETKNYYNTSV
jgi:hypothetical protein